jgi:hypothetical protein
VLSQRGDVRVHSDPRRDEIRRRVPFHRNMARVGDTNGMDLRRVAEQLIDCIERLEAAAGDFEHLEIWLSSKHLGRSARPVSVAALDGDAAEATSASENALDVDEVVEVVVSYLEHRKLWEVDSERYESVVERLCQIVIPRISLDVSFALQWSEGTEMWPYDEGAQV